MMSRLAGNVRQASGREDKVSDEEVEEAIALFGGDPREAVRALVGALHHLVSKGYARGQVRVVGLPTTCRAPSDIGAH
ncbi:MAG TPA: hypothetical protein VFY72_12890 [Beijerinckiaceae bacterium]|nr:hypothetical protein [Beijerinckiaceae bacterium]